MGYNIKNNQEILLDLADFTLQERPEDNLMVAISQAWYNGSYIPSSGNINVIFEHAESSKSDNRSTERSQSHA